MFTKITKKRLSSFLKARIRWNKKKAIYLNYNSLSVTHVSLTS